MIAAALFALSLAAFDNEAGLNGLWVERADDGSAQCGVAGAARFTLYLAPGGPPHPRSDNLGEAMIALDGGAPEHFILDGAEEVLTASARPRLFALSGGQQTTAGRTENGVSDGQHTGGLRLLIAEDVGGDLELRDIGFTPRRGGGFRLLPEGVEAREFNRFSPCAPGAR